VNVSRTIECANFWDALILRSLLEEQGVQVRQSDEAVRLSMVASGDLDQIKAAVAQLGNEFPRSGRVVIEGEPREDRAPEPSGEPRSPEPVRPAERSARPKPTSEPKPAPASAPAQALEPAQALDRAQEVEPTQAAEPAPAPEPPPAPEPETEPPDGLELTHTPEQPEPIPPPEPASEPPPPEPAPAPDLTQVLESTQAVKPTQAAEPVPAPESPPASEPSHDGEPSHPPQQPEPSPAPEPTPVLEPAQAAEPPESPEPTHTPEQPEPLPEPASEGQMWAVLYDDGMSVTTASERVARSLAEAERQRGRRVTVRRMDDVETHPRGVQKPARPPERARGEGPVRPSGTDEPSAPGPSRAVGGADTAPEPTAVRRLDENRTRPRRRLLLYALAAATIVVAAALVDHWGVLPRVGANTGSSPTQVGGQPQRPQLLPPLDQTPVMHFSNAVDATSPPAEPSAQPTSPAAGPSGPQDRAARPAGSPASAESLQPATGASSGGGPSIIARGG
jgi:hypothetical protein